MPFSVAILAVILSYIWVFEPRAGGAARAMPVASVLGLALLKASRSSDWGFRRDALLGGLATAAWTTLLGVAIVLAAGEALDTLHPRRAIGRSLALLTLWGGAQQFVLQTVVLREARELMPRRPAVIVAAGLFSVVHLPNSFLAAITFAALLV